MRRHRSFLVLSVVLLLGVWQYACDDSVLTRPDLGVARSPILLASAVLASGADGAEMIRACYIPGSGMLYRVGLDGLRDDCQRNHVPFSWTVGGGPAGQMCPQGQFVVGFDASGLIACAGPQPPGLEVCDGLDNNGNGQTDEGLLYCFNGSPAANTDGAACLQGWFDSDGDAANGCEATGTAELCDGLDNDGDGLIDEELVAPACQLQAGVCTGTRQTCGGSAGWLPCGPAEYPSDWEAQENTCDGKDNDCDGNVDEPFSSGGSDPGPDLGEACDGADSDACSEGVAVCSPDGVGTVCTDFTADDVEVCNGIDDDCDGSVDNGAVCYDGDACTIDSCDGGSCSFVPDIARCDDGYACTIDECDPLTGGCTSVVSPNSCLIDGACYSANSPNPNDNCLICDPLQNSDVWSRVPDGTPGCTEKLR